MEIKAAVDAGGGGKAAMGAEVPQAIRTHTAEEVARSKDGDDSAPLSCVSTTPKDTPAVLTEFGADTPTKAPSPSGPIGGSHLEQIRAAAEERSRRVLAAQTEGTIADGKAKPAVSKRRAAERKKTSGLFGNPTQELREPLLRGSRPHHNPLLNRRRYGNSNR